MTGWVLGFVIGALAAAVAGFVLLRAAIERVRTAERRARASERLAELGAMTGGLAHEIRNPLSTITLNAQILAEAIEDLPIEPDEKSRLTRRVGTLYRETDRLSAILADFLRYAGEVRLSREAADVNLLVDELVDFFHPQAERQGVRLRADLEPGGLRASVDVPQLKQAVLNLMLNAVQAMTGQNANNGTPELILKTRREASGGRDREGSAVIHVIDTGPGMDEETRAKIFEPYFSTKKGGTGLGLPTTRRIVEAHGGTLELYSEPGRGTDFAIRLPMEAAEERA